MFVGLVWEVFLSIFIFRIFIFLFVDFREMGLVILFLDVGNFWGIYVCLGRYIWGRVKCLIGKVYFCGR